LPRCELPGELPDELPEWVENLTREAGRQILTVYASDFTAQTKACT
jgi:hypothetical protein